MLKYTYYCKNEFADEDYGYDNSLENLSYEAAFDSIEELEDDIKDNFSGKYYKNHEYVIVEVNVKELRVVKPSDFKKAKGKKK